MALFFIFVNREVFDIIYSVSSTILAIENSRFNGKKGVGFHTLLLFLDFPRKNAKPGQQQRHHYAER